MLFCSENKFQWQAVDNVGCFFLDPAGAIILEKAIGFVLPCKEQSSLSGNFFSFPAREKNHTVFVLGGFQAPRGEFSQNFPGTHVLGWGWGSVSSEGGQVQTLLLMC